MKKFQICFYSTLIIILGSCTKTDTAVQNNTISTPILSAVTVDFIEKRADGPSAIASVLKNGGSTIIQKGIVYSATPNPTLETANKIISQSGDSSMRESIRGLAMNKTYYLKAFATNTKGTSYSNEISFKIPVDITWRDSTGLVIFYIFKDGDIGYVAGEIHGLMSSGAPAIGGAVYQCGNSLIGTLPVIGSGQLNTQKLINSESTCNSLGKAIVALNNTKPGGYGDWFLPSKDEFLKLRDFNSQYNLLIPMSYPSYWTSSEVDATNAYVIKSNTGATAAPKSGFSYPSIPIRAF